MGQIHKTEPIFYMLVGLEAIHSVNSGKRDHLSQKRKHGATSYARGTLMCINEEPISMICPMPGDHGLHQRWGPHWRCVEPLLVFLFHAATVSEPLVPPRIVRCLLMSLVILFSGISGAFAQQVCHLEVVAQTGVPVGGASPVALGQGPSISDAGKVAFIVRDEANQTGRVVVVSASRIVRNHAVKTSRRARSDVEATTDRQVIFWEILNIGPVLAATQTERGKLCVL